jgi:phosphate/sulfate permease
MIAFIIGGILGAGICIYYLCYKEKKWYAIVVSILLGGFIGGFLIPAFIFSFPYESSSKKDVITLIEQLPIVGEVQEQERIEGMIVLGTGKIYQAPHYVFKTKSEDGEEKSWGIWTGDPILKTYPARNGRMLQIFSIRTESTNQLLNSLVGSFFNKHRQEIVLNK